MSKSSSKNTPLFPDFQIHALVHWQCGQPFNRTTTDDGVMRSFNPGFSSTDPSVVEALRCIQVYIKYRIYSGYSSVQNQYAHIWTSSANSTHFLDMFQCAKKALLLFLNMTCTLLISS